MSHVTAGFVPAVFFLARSGTAAAATAAAVAAESALRAAAHALAQLIHVFHLQAQLRLGHALQRRNRAAEHLFALAVEGPALLLHDLVTPGRFLEFPFAVVGLLGF